MSWGEAGLVAAVVVAALMTLTWLVSLALRDASVVDIAWGAGFVAIAWAVAWRAETVSARGWLLVGLATVWGLRLSGYLAWRNLGKEEDYRYRELRQRWGDRFPLVSLVVVFGLQGVIMWVVSLPLQAGVPAPGGIGWLAGLGVALWGLGVFFEAVGDLQLARFKADPANRGRVMDRGLWRYTRHPNYFGDFCVWWGMWLVAAEAGAAWTVVGPLVMSVLLMRYSGVGLLERTITSRRPGYAEYMRRTNAFFPGPPKAPD
jgi:steroid 5-alpha reductase family enzyme